MALSKIPGPSLQLAGLMRDLAISGSPWHMKSRARQPSWWTRQWRLNREDAMHIICINVSRFGALTNSRWQPSSRNRV